MSRIESLESIHPDLISAFLTTGKGDGIPKDIQLFLKQLQYAAEIYETERNIKRAAKQLRIRINTLQGIKISDRACQARIYEAINYFCVDNNVSIKVWESDFANKYEDLAKLCLANDDYKNAKSCFDAAIECRRRASEIAEADRDLGITFLISPDITPELLGYESQNLKKIASKANDGFYIKLIDNLPIEGAEKKRLLRDADIEDAQIIEELPND